LNFLANIVKNKLTTHVGLISCSYFAPWFLHLLFMPAPHCFDYCSFIISFKIE
jgi:hypothetical protein